MKARSRWEHDPVLTRTLGTVGRLSGGPEERRSEDSIHTQMDSRGGLCSSNPWPYQAQSGSHQTSCVPGACSLQLRSPWAESRRRVELGPFRFPGHLGWGGCSPKERGSERVNQSRTLVRPPE